MEDRAGGAHAFVECGRELHAPATTMRRITFAAIENDGALTVFSTMEWRHR